MMSAVRLDGSVDAWYARLSGKRDDLEPGCRRQHQAASAPKLALSLKPKRRNHRHNPMLCITESHTVGRRGGGDYIQQGPHDSRQSRQPSFNTTSWQCINELFTQKYDERFRSGRSCSNINQHPPTRRDIGSNLAAKASGLSVYKLAHDL